MIIDIGVMTHAPPKNREREQMAKQSMLEGVRIVDLTSVVFGPYATQILADLGADVIKIEAPEGDPFRYSGKPAHSRGMSPGFFALNDDLIYVHCVGFGTGGPYSGLQAYDDVIQAASGTATLTGRADGTGKSRYLPSLVADKVAGSGAPDARW